MGRKKMTVNKKRGWKKVLYEQQEFPDNYVDPSFLSELKKNVNLRCYTWNETILAVAAVTQEISCTIIFVMTFAYLDYDMFSPLTLLVGTGIITLLLYVFYIVIEWKTMSVSKSKNTIIEEWKSSTVFLVFGYGLSPILKTLTETISTDTIYAMVTIMMIAHVVFQDYGADGFIVSSTLSLNAAIFGAVCLASRLSTTTHAFALLTTTAGLFVLAPFLRKLIQKISQRGHAVLTIFLSVVALVMVGSISYICAIFFTILIIFINILCPAGFIYCQKYKENIYGPWDEAVIKES